MKYDSYTEERNRLDLLNRIKEQNEPYSGRPQLYQVVAVDGELVRTTRYEWMHAAGMGDYALSKATPDDTRAIKHLVREGRIVPTMLEDFGFGAKTLRHLKHFDDVHFALDNQATPIMYEYAHFPERPDPVIRPDKSHDAAIKQLRDRIQYGRAEIDGGPILLRGGPVVWPIHTDREVIALRDRQRSFDKQAELAL